MTVTSCAWIPGLLERSEVSANIPRPVRAAVIEHQSQPAVERQSQPAMEPWPRKGRQAHDHPVTTSVSSAGFTPPGRRLTLAAGALAAVGASPAAAASLPCDIYASGGTPCVAAHSTTRALYASYNGPLYQVRRASDDTTTNISPLSAGGVANAAAQDSFCAGTTCVITEIYDQSGHGNNLTDAPAAGRPAARTTSRTRPRRRSRSAATRPTASTWRPAPGTATTAPRASRPATTPRASTRSSTARTTTAAAASTTATPRPATTTTATATWKPSTSATSRSGATAPATAPGSWPTWRTACTPASTRATTPTTRPPAYRFTTAMIEGEPNQWAILGGNAQSGGLSTVYSGPRPNVSGYNPMHKEGAIILGIGGDNSKGSAGTFYEGVHDLRLPVSRHRERRPGQHRLGRLRHRPRRRQRGDRAHRGRASTAPSAWTTTTPAPPTATRCRSGHCDGNTAAQNWTVNSNGTLTIDGGCMDITGANYSNGTLIEWWTCNGGANQQWQAEQRGAGQPGLRQMPRRSRLQHHQRDPADPVHLQRRQQPALDAALTVP